MKKRTASLRCGFGILLCSLIFLLALPMTAWAANISIILNGSPLSTDVPPILKNDRTLVPFRVCAEALGAQVDYAASAKTVTMVKDGTTVTLAVDGQVAYINQETVTLDVPAQVMDGRTLVPLRFVSEALNASVEWLEESQQVIINTQQTTEPQPEEPSTQPETPSEPDITLPSDPNAGQIDVSKEELINTLLNSCNYVREQKNLNALTLSAELSAMAESHSQDMATNQFFSSHSPSNGSLSQRAKAFQFVMPGENIAKVNLASDGSIQAAVTAWISNSAARANLLHASSGYIGIGLAQNPNNSQEYYVTVEFLPTWAYFTTLDHTAIQENKLTVEGYTTRTQDTLIVYRLSSSNANVYAEKQSYIVTPNQEGKFAYTVTFPQPGNYRLQMGASSITIQYQ